MTDLTTTPRPKTATTAGTSTAPSPSQPTLITQQQVLLGTAAAVASPPAKTRRFSDVVSAVVSVVSSVFAAPEKPRARKHYPPRRAYLEDALMAREMHRL